MVKFFGNNILTKFWVAQAKVYPLFCKRKNVSGSMWNSKILDDTKPKWSLRAVIKCQAYWTPYDCLQLSSTKIAVFDDLNAEHMKFKMKICDKLP